LPDFLRGKIRYNNQPFGQLKQMINLANAQGISSLVQNISTILNVQLSRSDDTFSSADPAEEKL